MKNMWNLSLGLSLAIHTIVLAGLPPLKKIKANKERIKIIKIFPQEIKKIEETASLKTISPSRIPPPYVEKLAKKTILNNDSQPIKKEVFSLTKEILLSDYNKPDFEKLKKNPVYMQYYKLIRERIRKNAYRYYNIEESGIVYLYFVILKNGSLNQISLSKTNTSASSNLIEIALKSVKSSAPFPPFPEELKTYSRLQFSVSIHFKNN